MYIVKMLKLFQFYIFFNSFLGKVLCQELYVGCYNNFNGTQPNTNHIQSVSQCLTDCKSLTSYFTAIKDGSSCHCGNITNTRVPSSNCNLTCGDNNEICGGNNLYAVYTDVPTYRGCFTDQETRDFENWLINDDRTLTIDKCYEGCSKHKYDFMGVQHGACFCGQQYGKYGRGAESDCNVNCYGDGKQICGGNWKNSVYSIGYLHGLNKSYSEVFHCLNGATDRNGTCTSKTCQPGWKGTKCNQRDCLINNGSCEQSSTCNEINLGKQNISECVCLEGFQSDSIYDECTDIDECTLKNPCNNSTSWCNNTIGSYDCVCKGGFAKSSSNHLICADVDECQSKPCNEPSETCNNTNGSFMCICSSGYNYTNQSDCIVSQCHENLHRCDNAFNCTKLEGYKCEVAEINTIEAIKVDLKDKIVGGVVGTIAVVIVATAIIILIYCLFIKSKKFYYRDEETYPGDTKKTKISVSEVNKYFANYKKDINDQFNKCPKDFGHPQSAASSPANVIKNRFKKMYPYDHNRVKLNDEHDYINASFVQTYGNPPNFSFIAAQGPKFETTEDFWKMVWDNNVKVIVMLTKCHELGKEKCYQYWPEEGSMAIGDFVIKNCERENRLNYKRRTFKVVLNNEEIKVCHYLYTAWMDKTIPENIFSLLNLREKVISMVDKKSQNNIVVHCSAGVGRTGTFIALDYLIRQAEQEGCVDFNECLKFLRNQRINMIQAPSQFELCIRAIALFHKIGKSTFMSIDDLNVFKKNVEKVTEDLICKQHELIEEEVGSNEVKAVNKADIKNTAADLEAVFLPSSEEHSSYVACAVSTAFSLDHLVAISDANYGVVILLDNQEISFVSDEYQQILHKSAIVKLDNKEVTDFCMKYSFQVEKNGEMTYENVELSGGALYINTRPKSTLLHVTKDVTTCYDVIIKLHSYVKPILDLNEKRMIVISRGSYDYAGFLVAAFNIMQMMEISKKIDVYETVFELRNIQPEVFKNIDLYKNLYSFAKHYVNHARCIMKTGRKTLMENPYENYA